MIEKLTVLKLAVQNFCFSLGVCVMDLVDWALRANALAEVVDGV